MPLHVPPAVLQPGYIAGRWYMPYGMLMANGSAIPTGTLRCLPFFLPAPMRVDALGVRIGTAVASGNARAAVYANNPATGRPTGAALAATGDLSTASAATVSEVLGAAVTLAAGFYWFVVQVDATAGTGSVTLQTSVGSFSPAGWLMGSTTQAFISGAAASSNLFVTVTQAYGSFPDMTGQTFTETAASSHGILQLRAA